MSPLIENASRARDDRFLRGALYLVYFALALMFLVLAATPAGAMQRCVSKEGKVTYTDSECDEGSKASGVRIYDSSGVDTKKGGSPLRSSTGRSNTTGPSSSVPQMGVARCSGRECRDDRGNVYSKDSDSKDTWSRSDGKSCTQSGYTLVCK